MDNKNEKTFADLFSSSNLSEEKFDDSSNTGGKSNEDHQSDISLDINNGDVNFGDLFNENDHIDDLNVSSITKDDSSNLNNLLNEESISDDIEDKTNLEDNSGIFFKEDIESTSEEIPSEISIQNSWINEEKKDDDIIEFVVTNNSEELNNSIFNEKQLDHIIEVNNDKLNEKDNNSEDFNLNDKNQEEITTSNLFFDNEQSGNENDGSLSTPNNLTTNNQVNFEGSLSFDNNVNSNAIESKKEDNLFFNDNLKDDKNSDDFNNNKTESINQMVEDKKNEKEKEVKEENVSISPFFQESSLEKNDFGIDGLEDKKISFDQTKNVNSKLDKLDVSNSKHFNVKLVQPKTSLLKFMIGVVSYAFFIFLVLILVTLLAYVLDIKIRAAKGDYSSPTFNAYVVLTGSMLPEIQVKDVVVTKKVDANELKVGDIITFASSDSRFLGTIITHRIIKKNPGKDGNITFQTQGDNNNVADSALVQPNNIYGKVILKIPKLGYLQDFLATQGGWIIVILLPCLVVISYDIVKIAKGIKRRKNKINVIK